MIKYTEADISGIHEWLVDLNWHRRVINHQRTLPGEEARNMVSESEIAEVYALNEIKRLLGLDRIFVTGEII